MRQIKVFEVNLGKEVVQEQEQLINTFLSQKQVKKITPAIVNLPDRTFWSIVVDYEDSTEKSLLTEKKLSRERTTSLEEIELSEEENALFEKLRNWRNEEAQKTGMPPFILFYNKELELISKIKPQTIEEILSLKGIRKVRVNQYGQDILRIVRGS